MKMKFRYRFEAAHRLTSAASPMCQTPHGHTWHVTIHWRAKENALNDANMAAEFAQVKGPWKKFVKETLDHSFFHHSSDPILPALRDSIPQFRGLPTPGDPTTEMLAVLFLKKCMSFYESQTDIDVEPYAIDLEETEVNSIFLNCQDTIFKATVSRLPKGWWNSTAIEDRSIEL